MISQGHAVLYYSSLIRLMLQDVQIKYLKYFFHVSSGGMSDIYSPTNADLYPFSYQRVFQHLTPKVEKLLQNYFPLILKLHMMMALFFLISTQFA